MCGGGGNDSETEQPKLPTEVQNFLSAIFMSPERAVSPDAFTAHGAAAVPQHLVDTRSVQDNSVSGLTNNMRNNLGLNGPQKVGDLSSLIAASMGGSGSVVPTTGNIPTLPTAPTPTTPTTAPSAAAPTTEPDPWTTRMIGSDR